MPEGVGMVVPGVTTWLRWSAGGSGDGGAWCDNMQMRVTHVIVAFY